MSISFKGDDNFMNNDYNKVCVKDVKPFYKLSASSISLDISQRSEVNNSFYYGRYSSNLNRLLEYKMLKLYNRANIEQEMRSSEEYSCRILSSGMQALISVMYILAPVCDNESEIVVAEDFYFEFIEYVKQFHGLKVNFIDFNNEYDIKAKISKNTKAVFVEPSSVPFFQKKDLRRTFDLIHKLNPLTQIVVDNTILTPYYYNPFNDGADICVDSLSKYINGHGDVIAGSIVLKTVLLRGVCFADLNLIGSQLDQFSSYLVNRGIKTFPLRMDRITSNGCKLYQFLCSAKICNLFKGRIEVYYAGVGGVVCFSLGNILFHNRLIDALKFISRGCTFGTEVTLADVPVRTGVVGKWSSFVRVSLGLEQIDDIIGDIESAFFKVGNDFTFVEDEYGFVVIDREIINNEVN